MTKERLETLRAKLNDPEYINKACSEIGTRFSDIWYENDCALPEIENPSKHQSEYLKMFERENKREKRDKAIYRDSQTMTEGQLAIKYNLSQPAVHRIIKKGGVNGRT